MDQEALQATAVQSILFAGLSDEASVAILSAASWHRAAQATTLFHQGDHPDHLLQVVSGLVKMTHTSTAGARTTLRIMRAGDLLGCVAVFQQHPHLATAIALEDTIALSWTAAQFFELMKRHPSAVDNALRIVGTRARELLQRVVETSGKHGEQRIAGALLRLAGQVGTEVSDGIQIKFPVTRDDLAEMAGVTYFTISRTLSAWQKLGFVRSGRQRITILVMRKLAQIAEGRVP